MSSGHDLGVEVGNEVGIRDRREGSIGVVLEMGNESREGKRRSEPSGGCPAKVAYRRAQPRPDQIMKSTAARTPAASQIRDTARAYP